MGIKEYNQIQVVVFEELGIIGRKDFCNICAFISSLKNDSNFSVSFVINELKKSFEFWYKKIDRLWVIWYNKLWMREIASDKLIDWSGWNGYKSFNLDVEKDK